MKSRLMILVIVLLLGSSSIYSQSFYVEKTAKGYEQPILEKLISENYKVTSNKDKAEYTIECIFTKTSAFSAKGCVAIIDNKSGNFIAESKQVKARLNIFNGYANTKMQSMKKIANKYLIPLIDKYVKK